MYVIVALFAVLTIESLHADLGPKPRIAIAVYNAPGIDVTAVVQSGNDFGQPDARNDFALIQCKDADCTSGGPLGPYGPQHFDCSFESDTLHCGGLAYGFARYNRLVIRFEDRIRSSNVFTVENGGAFDAIVRKDDLVVSKRGASESVARKGLRPKPIVTTKAESKTPVEPGAHRSMRLALLLQPSTKFHLNASQIEPSLWLSNCSEPGTTNSVLLGDPKSPSLGSMKCHDLDPGTGLIECEILSTNFARFHTYRLHSAGVPLELYAPPPYRENLVLGYDEHKKLTLISGAFLPEEAPYRIRPAVPATIEPLQNHYFSADRKK